MLSAAGSFVDFECCMCTFANRVRLLVRIPVPLPQVVAVVVLLLQNEQGAGK